MDNIITFEDFTKVDMRIGTIIEVNDFSNAGNIMNTILNPYSRDNCFNSVSTYFSITLGNSPSWLDLYM
jgi:tRNA-binding EMAP/Myf-like protein